jgi:hypothetical protein
MNDADVLIAAFPDLALLKFHRRKVHLSRGLIQERCGGG